MTVEYSAIPFLLLLLFYTFDTLPSFTKPLSPKTSVCLCDCPTLSPQSTRCTPIIVVLRLYVLIIVLARKVIEGVTLSNVVLPRGHTPSFQVLEVEGLWMMKYCRVHLGTSTRTWTKYLLTFQAVFIFCVICTLNTLVQSSRYFGCLVVCLWSSIMCLYT